MYIFFAFAKWFFDSVLSFFLERPALVFSECFRQVTLQVTLKVNSISADEQILNRFPDEMKIFI